MRKEKETKKQADTQKATNRKQRKESTQGTRGAARNKALHDGLVTGQLQLTAKGFGFVLPDDREAHPQDIYISQHALGGAMNDDRVAARLQPGKLGRSGNPEGEIVQVLVRAHARVVGTFLPAEACAFVVPDDRRIGQDIYVAPEDFGGAGAAQKVVVEITKWPEGRRSAEGRVTEILGSYGDPGLDILSIIKQKELPLAFPKAVERAAERVPLTISPKEREGRLDRRSWCIVTVDGDDTKDIDDAIYVRKLNQHTYLLGVYIADVSYYVKEDSVLDKEARERATSVYLVDRVLPMLPTRLSNGICSLNEGEDRLAMACEMHISVKTGQVTRYTIAPAIIRSHHRLTYTVVRNLLAGETDENLALRRDYRDILPMLAQMRDLCLILRQKRMARGSLDFDLPEQKVVLDADGTPVEIVPRQRTIAEQMIEEFMLAANETVARHLTDAQWPCVYRVHEEPAAEKMAALAQLLAGFGVTLQRDEEGRVTPGALQQALAQFEGRLEQRLVNLVALRSLKQAVYQTQNVGHYGLAARYYCHFTSPIRRYPDTLVHRLLHQWLEKPKLSRAEKAALTERLQAMAQHASTQERNAADAERQTVDVKKAEYMAQRVGEEFDGTISGVMSFGLFVELANGVEGLLHASSLLDDYYEYNEKQYALVGRHTRHQYRLGDPLRIEVLQVSTADRRIDFILAGETAAGKARIRAELAHEAGGKANAVDVFLAQHAGKASAKGKGAGRKGAGIGRKGAGRQAAESRDLARKGKGGKGTSAKSATATGRRAVRKAAEAPSKATRRTKHGKDTYQNHHRKPQGTTRLRHRGGVRGGH